MFTRTHGISPERTNIQTHIRTHTSPKKKKAKKKTEVKRDIAYTNNSRELLQRAPAFIRLTRARWASFSAWLSFPFYFFSFMSAFVQFNNSGDNVTHNPLNIYSREGWGRGRVTNTSPVLEPPLNIHYAIFRGAQKATLSRERSSIMKTLKGHITLAETRARAPLVLHKPSPAPFNPRDFFSRRRTLEFGSWKGMGVELEKLRSDVLKLKSCYKKVKSFPFELGKCRIGEIFRWD